MADRLSLPGDVIGSLEGGKSIVVITRRHAVDLNDELELIAEGDSPHDPLTALVVAIQPAASMTTGEGDAVLLRVYGPNGPVLDDETFMSQRLEIEAQWR